MRSAALLLAVSLLPTQAQAQSEDVAWELLEGLTTEVGPRLAGTPAEARARAWAVKRLTALGFQNVRAEPFRMPVWVRGEERAEVLSPFPQELRVTALGSSPSTGPQGVEGEVAFFPTLAALQAAPLAQVKGKVAFVSHAMQATQDGSHYGAFGGVRWTAPGVAAGKGALAILIRSVGTDRSRAPHTGNTGFKDARPIPAGALSVLDAEQLERMVRRGQPVRVRLTLTPRSLGDGESGNVLAEVPGSDASAGLILVGAHLDSWDLGTGALDDGAGLAIITAAALAVQRQGQPRRTIRVGWFGGEETGGHGGAAYARAHAAEKHVLAAESDGGADRVWRFQTTLGGPAEPVVARLAAALGLLGIARSAVPARDFGVDVGEVVRAGTPGLGLQQSSLRYFDFHHTAEDTLDKVDPAALRQNVEAWTAMLSIVANAPEPLVVAPATDAGR